MKRLYISAAILLALAGLAACHVFCLGKLITGLDELLLQAEQQVEAENWSRAEALTRQALDDWETHSRYLHVTLRHEDIDGVLVSFHETLAFLTGQERQPSEYAAANAQLRVRLSLLLEAELPTLKNLL